MATNITATINSKTQDGGEVELTVLKSGADSALLSAKNWTKNRPPPANPKLTNTNLIGAKVSANGLSITCIADVFFGPDPVVTLVLSDATVNPKTVTITITGTLGGLGDGTSVYNLTDADYKEILDFIAAAQYPVTA
jgi:hypothetical protein